MDFFVSDRPPFTWLVAAMEHVLLPRVSEKFRSSSFCVFFLFGNNDPMQEEVLKFYKGINKPWMEEVVGTDCTSSIVVRPDLEFKDGTVIGNTFSSIFVKSAVIEVDGGKRAPVDMVSKKLIVMMSKLGMFEGEKKEPDVQELVGDILVEYSRNDPNAFVICKEWIEYYNRRIGGIDFSDIDSFTEEQFKKHVKDRIDEGHFIVLSNEPMLVKKFMLDTGAFSPLERPYMFLNDRKFLVDELFRDNELCKGIPIDSIIGTFLEHKEGIVVVQPIYFVHGIEEEGVDELVEMIMECLESWRDRERKGEKKS